MHLINKKTASFLLSIVVSLPIFAYAASTPIAGGGSNDPVSTSFQLVPSSCFGSGDTQSVANKDQGKCGWKDLIFLLNTLIQFMAYLAAVLSAVAFAYAGFLYMTAMGDSGKIEQAHGIFKKTFTGILFVLVGWLLIATILKILGVQQAYSLIDLSNVKTLEQ